MRSALRTVDRRWAITSVVRPCISVSSACWTEALGLVVERRGRFVEHQDRRVLEQRAGDGDALALAAGEALAELADHRVVALRQLRG